MTSPELAGKVVMWDAAMLVFSVFVLAAVVVAVLLAYLDGAFVRKPRP